jgi:dihydroceramidase
MATSVVCHRVVTYRKSPFFIRWFSAALVFAVLAETAYHTFTDEQMVHELSFVFLIIVVAMNTHSLIKLRVRNPDDKKMRLKAVIFGAGNFSSTIISKVVARLRQSLIQVALCSATYCGRWTSSSARSPPY